MAAHHQPVGDDLPSTHELILLFKNGTIEQVG
jgi:hypothetical protein